MYLEKCIHCKHIFLLKIIKTKSITVEQNFDTNGLITRIIIHSLK